MFTIPQYKNPISLIPGGLPQLLDYQGAPEILESIRYSFEEAVETAENGQKVVRLHAFRKNEEGEFADEMDPSRLDKGTGYNFSGARSLEPWLNKWLPMPFFRVRIETAARKEEPSFEYGPTNWARGYLTRLDNGAYRLVLAFDMQVEPKNGNIYAALTSEDVDATAHFRLAWRFRDNAWFLDLAWVEEWLRDAWEAWCKETRRRNDDDWKFQHLASYLCFLEAVNLVSSQCDVEVVRPDNQNCVNVDLVLDIGNSRTTGILVETQVQSSTNLNDSYLLQLRDMSKPEQVYMEPFDTRVEFSEIMFGSEALSMRSGRRTPAFSWPSPVRIGPEAGRLATLSRCEKGSTGMSSPKRYLWDERDWKRTWRFNTTTEQAPYVTRGPLAQLINSSGTPLCCMEDKLFTRNPILRLQEKESAFESLFTRSSLMMFLLIEIIQQALMTINSPGQRMRRELPGVPRRLRQIIFTVPAGMPLAEQRIYKRWALWAVHVLWEALDWSEFYIGEKARRATGPCDYRTSPIVRCDWDEATCTQLVFIYNEIIRRFQGDANLFCELMGRKRLFNGRETPSVRVAAIDIGGGTTDLSITTFALASDPGSTPRMAPRPDFHDGFNLAGDDILLDVICNHVLQALGASMKEAGVPNLENAFGALFGQNKHDSSKEVLDQRIQFVRQIAIPVALTLLQLYERSSHANGELTFRFADCFALPQGGADPARSEQRGMTTIARFPEPSAAARRYVADYVAQFSGNTDFDVLETRIALNLKNIDETVRKSLRAILANLCEVVSLYDCDALLLTGRPSKLPGIINTISSLLPVPPSRIYPMADYQVGGWYPFSDALGNLTDPKTTVVVGAILCALAEGHLEGFSFDPQSLRVPSTARYIGEMETSGQIKNEKVWFRVDPVARTVEPPEVDVTLSGPTPVGFRQLDAERWTTTRFYLMDFANDAAARENKKLIIRLRLTLPSDDEDSDAARDEGEFEIVSMERENGESPSGRPVVMRLQTLPHDQGFWMDTGVLLPQ